MNAAAIERRNRNLERVLSGEVAELEAETARERYAGLLRIERGPAAYRVTFPAFRERYRDTRPILEAVKAIPGRRFDPMSQAWTLPLEAAGSVESLAQQYGAQVEDVAPTDPGAAARIAELEDYIARLEAELALHEHCVVPVWAARESHARKAVSA